MKSKLLIFLLVITFGGCKDLDETVFDFISPDKFFKTEADANASCIGMYSPLNQPEYMNMVNGIGCVFLTNDGRFNYHNRGGISSGDELLNRAWQYRYEIIRKANSTINNLKQSSIADHIKIRYISEAKVLRAYAYYRLVRLWGDIPYRDEASTSGSHLEPTAIKDVYQNIIKDLAESIPYAWLRHEKPPGRITKEAAQLLLADVYVTMASSAQNYNPATSARGLKPYHDAFSGQITTYYQNAKALASEVMASTSFRLLEDWTKMWGVWVDADYRFNDEFIWSTQSVPGIWGGSAVAQAPVRSDYAPAKTGNYGGAVYNYVASFDRNDLRFTWGFIWEYQNLATSTATRVDIERYRRNVDDPSYPPDRKVKVISNTPTLRIRENNYWIMRMKKFVDQTFTVSNGAIDMPLYRMAEAYLIYAEAENELNGMTQDAVDKINAVRSRVNAPIYTAGQFSKEVFRGKILDEYLWEFGLEIKDHFHIARFGQLEERAEGVEARDDGKEVGNPRPRTADNYWLPYPDGEKTLNRYIQDIDRMSYQ